MSTTVESGRVRRDRVQCEACGRAVRAKAGDDGVLRPIRHKDRRTGHRCERRVAIPQPAPSGTWPRVECRVCGRAVRAKLARGGSVLRPLRHKDRRTGQHCETRRDPVAPPAPPAPRPVAANDGAAVLAAGGDVAESLARLPAEARRTSTGEEEHERRLALAAQTGSRTYRAQWALFRLWCETVGVWALPAHPELLRIYAMHLGATGRKRASMYVALYAVVAVHEACDLASEALLAAHRSVSCKLRRRPSPSIASEELKAILAACGGNVMGLRDRALLLATYHGRLRCSRVVALDVADLQREADSYLVQVRETGKAVRLSRSEDPALCPVQALDRWLAALSDLRRETPTASEPLFMAIHAHRIAARALGGRLGAGDVTRALQRRAAAAQLDESRYTATTLRSADNAAPRRRPARAA
jgi:site-specific recombinase XerC